MRETVRARRSRPGGVSVMEVTTPSTMAMDPEDEDEEEPREPPPHQNGCPTAK